MKISDHTLDILSELHRRRMDFASTAAKMSISVGDVEAARAIELNHTRDVYLASVARTRSGRDRVMTPDALGRLAAKLPDAQPKHAAKLKKRIADGFYGQI